MYFTVSVVLLSAVVLFRHYHRTLPFLITIYGLCTGVVEVVTSGCWVYLTLEKEGFTYSRNVETCKLCYTA
jgi:hypothetical protein